MRVLLRKTANGSYYQDPGKWVSNPEKGFDFGTIYQAMEYAWQISPDEMELALAFDSSSLISAISLKAAHEELSRRRV
jgi:hypothetical protein